MLTVDSPYSFVTSIFITPFKFIVPLNTSSPSDTSFGNDSPVNAFVSSVVFPSTIVPSNGIFSPGFTIIISFIFTSSGDTFWSSPFLSTLAKSGLISINSDIDFLDLLTA